LHQLKIVVLLSIKMLATCDDFGGAGFSLRGASAPQILVAARRIAGQAPWPAAGARPAPIRGKEKRIKEKRPEPLETR
jgi:hypothetical protein